MEAHVTPTLQKTQPRMTRISTNEDDWANDSLSFVLIRTIRGQ